MLLRVPRCRFARFASALPLSTFNLPLSTPVTFFLLLPFSISAQTPLPDSVALQTVVIQATRTRAGSPVPHTNLSADRVAQTYQVQDIPFLLTAVPSLVETSDAGAGVGYTGLRIRGSDPTRVNVTLNGVPLNDAESQGVFWVDLPDLAASASEIQVQRGVGTSTNGAGAFGATVNVDLSRVAPEPYAVLTGSAGSFATGKLSASAGTGLIGGKVAFSGRFSRIHSDGYIDRAGADLNSLHLSGAYIGEKQSLQAHLLSGHEIIYQAWNGVPAQFLDTRRTYNTAGTERPGAPYEDEVDDYTQRHLLLHYKYLLPHGLQLQLNGHYTRGYGYYEQYKAGEAFSDYGLPDFTLGDTSVTETDLVRRRWLDNYFYGATFALQWQPPVNLSWMSGPPGFTLGGAASRYEGQHYGQVIWSEIATAPKDFRYYNNRADKRDANIFLKMEMGFAGGLSAFLDLQVRGVRYEFLGFNNELENVSQSVALGFFNPKAGLTWTFSKKYALYGFFGVGNREPNRDDYTQSSPASRPSPERLYDAEAGIRASLEGWSLSANFFHMQYRNQLAPDGRLNDVGAYVRTNVPDSYRTGVEVECNGFLTSRLLFSGNAALSRNKVRAFTEYRDNWDTGGQDMLEYRNTDLAFSPAVVMRGELSYTVLKHARHSLSLSSAGKYVGRQYLDNTSNPNTRLPAYFYTDLRLNYDLKNLAGHNLSLILSLNNVFDRHFVSNGWTYRFASEGYDPRPDDPYSRAEGQGVYNLTGYFPQAGRNWMATLRLEF